MYRYALALAVVALSVGCDAAPVTTVHVADERLVEPTAAAFEAWAPVTVFDYRIVFSPGIEPAPDRNTVTIGRTFGPPELCSPELIAWSHNYEWSCAASFEICEELLHWPFTADDVQQILSHEVGHYFGAKHSDGGVMLSPSPIGAPVLPTALNVERARQRGSQPCE